MVRLQRGEKGDDQGNAKRKWFEEKQKRREEELQRLGLPAAEIHRIQTAEHAEQMYKKQDKKVAPTGWEAFNQKALYEAYERRAGNIPYSQEVRDAMKDSRNGCLGTVGRGVPCFRKTCHRGLGYLLQLSAGPRCCGALYAACDIRWQYSLLAGCAQRFFCADTLHCTVLGVPACAGHAVAVRCAYCCCSACCRNMRPARLRIQSSTGQWTACSTVAVGRCQRRTLRRWLRSSMTGGSSRLGSQVLQH